MEALGHLEMAAEREAGAAGAETGVEATEGEAEAAQGAAEGAAEAGETLTWDQGTVAQEADRGDHQEALDQGVQAGEEAAEEKT